MKTNPRRRPATQADVERARREGWVEGMRIAEAIFLTVLHDRHAGEIDPRVVWDEIVEKTRAMDAGYFTAADLRRTLLEEYGIELLGGPSKAIAHDRRTE
jgi:hypothetical protein